KNVMMGGQVGTAGHISIADGSKIAGQSGITKTVKEPNKALSGTPAAEVSGALRIQAMSRNLPELEKRVKELEKLVEQFLAERVNA
ncbi:MAG: UDP-3-O-(3-hydroxymyristoyl)glucosamine N-acyltransferase, partial [Bacteroidota bacterium]